MCYKTNIYIIWTDKRGSHETIRYTNERKIFGNRIVRYCG